VGVDTPLPTTTAGRCAAHGGGLSRIDESSRVDLPQLVIKSFERRSRSTRICPELRIVLRPEDLARVDVRALRTVTGQ
jgi:hypothetical protein